MIGCKEEDLAEGEFLLHHGAEEEEEDRLGAHYNLSRHVGADAEIGGREGAE